MSETWALEISGDCLDFRFDLAVAAVEMLGRDGLAVSGITHTVIA